MLASNTLALASRNQLARNIIHAQLNWLDLINKICYSKLYQREKYKKTEAKTNSGILAKRIR